MKIIFLFLAFITLQTNASTNELSLYVIPSPKGLDWSGPRSLALSALKNRLTFRPRFIGHVFVELTCGAQHELTGMVGKNFDYLNQLLIQQRGLGILYHSFEGRLEDKEEIQKELADYLKSGRASFLTVKISPSQCRHLLKYLSEYRAMNVGRHYGLAHRPRHGEGAGCSAFGISFLDVLNLIEEEMRLHWSQTINIPLKYAGPPLTQETVNFLFLILSADSWAKEELPHQKLTYWDPDKIHGWIQKVVAQKRPHMTLSKKENAHGVVIDRSALPVPEESIWRQVIDPKNPKQVLVEPKKKF
jgi:hypothetical protein